AAGALQAGGPLVSLPESHAPHRRRDRSLPNVSCRPVHPLGPRRDRGTGRVRAWRNPDRDRLQRGLFLRDARSAACGRQGGSPSYVSFARDSMPLLKTASRSSLLANTERTRTRVRPSPMSSSVKVSTLMWPAIGSNSKVWTTRSGGTISRYSPLNQNSFPSAARLA